MRVRVLAAVTVLLVTAASAPSLADADQIPGHPIDRPVAGAIIGVTLVGALGASLVPMREPRLWRRELWEIDEVVHDNFSRRAAHLSDGLLAAAIAAPIAYLTGPTIEDADGDRLLIYGQAMAINATLAQAAKHLVQRPRPYLYATSKAGQAYARAQGADAHRSFYSGHAALSFGAAVTGAYLLGASSADGAARATAWGVGLGVATATANLRVRAGKHFYSDVVIGSLVGIAVGYAVPALHAEGRPYVPSGEELAAAAAGVLGGMLLSQLLPLERRAHEPTATEPGSLRSRLQLAPVPMANGLGISIGGAL